MVQKRSCRHPMLSGERGGTDKGFCLLPKTCSSTPHFARPKSKSKMENDMTWSSALSNYVQETVCGGLYFSKNSISTSDDEQKL